MSESISEALESALAKILPDEIVVAAGRIGEVPLELCDEERRCASRSVPSRQREFFTGRSLARRALRTLGCEDAPLLANANGAPHWPPGATGSVSHAGSLCIVVVANQNRLRGVGVDLEPAEPLEPELWPKICTEDEMRWLDAQSEVERGLWARWFFSAKESVYKLQSPLTGIFLEFQDVRLRAHAPECAAGCFDAVLPPAVGDRLSCDAISGRYVTEAGFLMTAALLLA